MSEYILITSHIVPQQSITVSFQLVTGSTIYKLSKTFVCEVDASSYFLETKRFSGTAEDLHLATKILSHPQTELKKLIKQQISITIHIILFQSSSHCK